jgi:predicted AAA+ superfamily ATPase
VLTGSHRFGLLTGISQSLAGRAATVSLLPFSLGELKSASLAPTNLNELLLRGLYPPVHDRGLEASTWYGNYIRTYVERDVRELVNIRDLGTFQRFVALCAGRTGQLLNLSALAGDAGVSHTTARGWISVLEAGYLIHLARPHHRNFNKRLVKTPMLYFLEYRPGLSASSDRNALPTRYPSTSGSALPDVGGLRATQGTRSPGSGRQSALLAGS